MHQFSKYYYLYSMCQGLSVIHTKKQKIMVEDVQNNGFMIYVINKKIDANALLRNIIYIIKKLHYKSLV